jgi:hypothetical protein
MWLIAGAPDGSFYFEYQPNMLDQLLVHKNMATGNAPIKVDPATVPIFRLPAMANPGVYPKPMPFGGMGKPVNQNGFSNHFATTIRITEVDWAGAVNLDQAARRSRLEPQDPIRAPVAASVPSCSRSSRNCANWRRGYERNHRSWRSYDPSR